jgi:hypothetical protein
MKKIRAFCVLVIFIGLLLGSGSCTVFFSKDNGNHKGWYKNPGNNHNAGYSDQGNHNNKNKK